MASVSMSVLFVLAPPMKLVAIQASHTLLVCCLKCIVTCHGYVVSHCCFIFFALVDNCGICNSSIPCFMLFICSFLHFIGVYGINEDVPFEELSGIIKFRELT